jgi:sarcosine oxidase subunit beta
MAQPHTLAAPAVIIGGGIVGGAAAYYLARRGVKAVVLEKGIVGGQASGRNGGGVRAQCRDRRERRLAMASIKLWEGLERELGADVEYVQGGNIRLAATEARMPSLAAEGEEELADGLPVEVWDRDELRRRAPYLSGRFIGAKYCATDGVANPILATWAFAWAAARAGAVLMQHTEALDLELHDGAVTAVLARGRQGELRIETPLVIHAGGPWSAQFAEGLGVPIPITPATSYVAVTQRVPARFTEFVSSHDLSLYMRPARAGHVHVGGVGLARPTFDQAIPRDVLPHLARAPEMAPALAGARFLRAWAGTLAMTPDRVPMIGPVDGVRGYLLAAGFSGHGFCLGPIVGKLLGEWVCDGKPSMALDELRPSRFAG